MAMAGGITEQQKEWAIKISAGVVFLMIFFSLFISPGLRDIAVLGQNVRNAHKRIGLYQEIRSLKQVVAGHEDNLASLPERAQILGRISDVANQNQIRLQALTPKTAPEGGYVQLKIDMDGQGNFLSLIKFLQAIEKIGFAIKVSDISALWQPLSNPKDKNYPLQLQIIFETFLKQRAKKNV